ncbi:flagellar export protein FliJ [Paenibacillus campi]|uniref:flagellar export protein FliJ n=1 Tax=Paenibacillus campi TaxID=3106031 RepID=UPI002AFFB860|nr:MULTISPECIES: flagellar export protein FliJ [unclassified Paenibacillus]
MNFQYNFQKVVDIKSGAKNQAEWLLSSALGELQAEEQSLDQLLEDQNRTLEAINQAIEQSAPIMELQNMQRYVVYLDQAIAKKIAAVRKAQLNVDHKKLHLTEKMVDEKVWLQAKDKAKAKFMHEYMLREQNALDEMATVRFAMQSR